MALGCDFAKKKFKVPMPNSQAFGDNYDRIFRKKESGDGRQRQGTESDAPARTAGE